MPPTYTWDSKDVPQTRSLTEIRSVVEAISAGASSTTAIVAQTDIRHRQVDYALTAGRTMGFLRKAEDGYQLLPPGRKLLSVGIDTPEERTFLIETIKGSEVLSAIAPNLFDGPLPAIGDIASSIVGLTGMAEATARHRAGALIAWYKQLVGAKQTTLASGPIPHKKREGLAPNDDAIDMSQFGDIPPVPKKKTNTLVIRNFAQISEATLELGDLTVLVGAQGTGKSLALQWLKTALDGKQIVSALRDAGQDVRKSDALVDLVFGVGMGAAWGAKSSVTFNGKRIGPTTISKLGSGKERVFFIPAHRAMLISDGWAAPFQKLTGETPVVARLFSQNLFDRFNARDSDKLFPLDRVLKEEYRTLIDEAVFHGGTVGLEQDRQHAKRLKLTHGTSQLPFMTWTAGQREFTPLMLGFYHLLPPRRILKQPGIDWVVVEEPEMGLHPQAITVFMLLVLDLLWRGYRVVLSTHSSLVLTAVWMLRCLQENGARWQLVCDGFGVEESRALKKVAQASLRKVLRVHLLEFGADNMVHSKDISSLDPGSDDEGVSGWGGLTGFGSRFGDAVRVSANERDS